MWYVQPFCTPHENRSQTYEKILQNALSPAFRSSLALNEKSGRAEYRRLDNNDSATIKCKNGQNKTVEATIDNRDIVLSNPYLIMKYDCHICIDMVQVKLSSRTYTNTYISRPILLEQKSRTTANEIEAYRSVRYISSSEAMWQILGSGRKNACQLLFSYVCTLKESSQLSSMKQTPRKNNDR